MGNLNTNSLFKRQLLTLFIFRSIIFLIFGLIVLGIGIGITGKEVYSLISLDLTLYLSFSGHYALRGREGRIVRALCRILPRGGPPPPPQPILLCHESQPNRGTHLGGEKHYSTGRMHVTHVLYI